MSNILHISYCQFVKKMQCAYPGEIISHKVRLDSLNLHLVEFLAHYRCTVVDAVSADDEPAAIWDGEWVKLTVCKWDEDINYA